MKRKEEHVNIEIQDDDETTGFINSVKEDYQCVICFDLLCEPVVIPECGHTCCRICLKQWFANVSPEQNVNCPAGCKAKIKRVVPATCVFIQNEIESRFPTSYAARKKEVQDIKIPSRFSHILKASSESREFRMYLLEVKASRFWKFSRWWKHFLIFLFACVTLLASMHYLKTETGEGVNLEKQLLDGGVSESSASLFQDKSLRFFLKLNKEDFRELGVPASDLDLLNSLRQKLENENIGNNDFWVWRQENVFFATTLCVMADYLPRTALLVYGIYLPMPMFFEFIHFQLPWWSFALYGTLCLCLPEAIWFSFWLRFAQKSPWFVSFILLETLNTFAKNWKQWNLKYFKVISQSFTTFSALYLLPSFVFNSVFYLWLTLPTLIYFVEVLFPVWITFAPDVVDQL